MRFEKENKKSVGRTKGARGRLFVAELACRDAGLNPMQALAHLALHGESQDIQLKALAVISKYVYPTKQAVQLTGEVGIKFILEDYLKKDE
jgi:hypothetical protein